ncbi:unnamed protein product [Effrenium voratum]|uniref:Uncharacterized protein n=1 Tax=Effrenium voratum TaxID=2562239 RepID=A0AA36NMP2_9DINO|nr:unnamed protein product [Effrenium voratum]CAJ1454787.1 unnamed protein product [Effrenium voratum]
MMLCGCCQSQQGQADDPVVTTRLEPDPVLQIPVLTVTPPDEPSGTSLAAKAVDAAAPSHGITFSFELPDKSVRDIVFVERPLGMDFTSTMPMFVTAVKPQSHADVAGVKPRWIITHVQGARLPADLTAAMGEILRAVKSLPVPKA